MTPALAAALQDTALPAARTLMLVNVALLLLTVGFFTFIAFVLIRRSIRQRMESERLAAMGTASARILHQVKNPMQTLLLQAETLSLMQDPEQQRRLATGIVSESKRLSDLLGELSAFAAGGRRQLTPVRVPLGALVRELAAAEQVDAERNGVRLEARINSEIDVRADVYFLRQALQNLVRNAREALQHAATPEAGVTITLSQRGGEAVIEVADNGPGIAPEKADRLFEPFVTTKAKGMGLGLPIARDIIEAHSGRIEVRTRAGQGTTFIVMIPSGPAD